MGSHMLLQYDVDGAEVAELSGEKTCDSLWIACTEIKLMVRCAGYGEAEMFIHTVRDCSFLTPHRSVIAVLLRDNELASHVDL